MAELVTKIGIKEPGAETFTEAEIGVKAKNVIMDESGDNGDIYKYIGVVEDGGITKDSDGNLMVDDTVARKSDVLTGNHASSTNKYGAATNLKWGHVKVAANGGIEVETLGDDAGTISVGKEVNSSSGVLGEEDGKIYFVKDKNVIYRNGIPYGVAYKYDAENETLEIKGGVNIG